MVNHFVVTTQLWVLVLQRVEAVWALRNDLAHSHAVQHFNVWNREHLEEVFVTRTTSRVTCTHFAWSQNGNINVCALEQLGHCLRDFLVLVIE